MAVKSFGGSWYFRTLLVIVPVVAVVLSLPHYRLTAALSLARAAWVEVLLAVTLYGCSHTVRAVRLALIAAPALNLPMRTLVLLHFYTAPVSFIVPFKLGEVYRWHQLAWLSKQPLGALVLLLLERTLDSTVLLAVLVGVAIMAGRLPPHTGLISGLLALATAAGLFAFFIAPRWLGAIQAYILQHHAAASARKLLSLVDSARLMTQSGNLRLRGNSVLLLSLSALIWALDSGAMVILSQPKDWQAGAVLSAVLTMNLTPDQASQHGIPGTALYVLASLATLLLIWPAATAMYLSRIRLPRRITAPPPRALSAHREKRISLMLTRTSL